MANKDTLDGRVRANPLTGQVDCIPVSGDFRDTYNLIAAITVNNKKGRSMVYTMGTENGTAESFMEFIDRLLSTHIKFYPVQLVEGSLVLILFLFSMFLASQTSGRYGGISAWYSMYAITYPATIRYSQ